MLRGLIFLSTLGALALGAALWFTRPERVDLASLALPEGDAARGETVFWAAGCASCHKANGSDTPLVLAGGQRFASDFGTFLAPNISPDPIHGIGEWTVEDFANAVWKGTSPEGRHYYPAFPYTSYARMSPGDLADLWAFFQTLPHSDSPSLPHELGFPFNIRASLGGWKILFAGVGFTGPAPSPQIERGRYLVEALGHCAECHTGRNLLGGLDRANWLKGAPNPSGQGRIPGITPAQLKWSETDIAYYLETGFTPDFDSAGGKMADVISGLSQLPPEDRAAIAAYLKAL
ncbi:MAG: cytochrome c [Silicimonas sp.]|nr:cytochrome c [Silicimonas sp.]